MNDPDFYVRGSNEKGDDQMSKFYTMEVVSSQSNILVLTKVDKLRRNGYPKLVSGIE